MIACWFKVRLPRPDGKSLGHPTAHAVTAEALDAAADETADLKAVCGQRMPRRAARTATQLPTTRACAFCAVTVATENATKGDRP